MITPVTILILCWIIYMGYWVMNWTNVKPSKVRSSHKPVMVILGVAALLALLLVSRSVFKDNVWFFIDRSAPISLTILGDIFALTGVTIAVSARRTLSDNWSATPEVKKGHTLVTDGIYGVIRHPIYTGVIIMGLGVVFVLESAGSLIFFALLLIKIFSRIPVEEQLMTKTFPEAYPNYKKRTKALIPFVI